MYSWEISNEMNKSLEKIGDKEITSDVYQKITAESPQISRIKYNPVTGRFEMWTSDNYYFDFKVRKV